MTKVDRLAELGQSIWYDSARRALLDSGELQALVDAGVRGVISNPSIFERVITGSTDYDADLGRLVDEGKAVEVIYEALVVEDIRRAADLLRPVYDRTNGLDGYASLEVNPTLAHDTDKTIAEAQRLFAMLDRPNVMIIVPATPAGIPAIEILISEGINVNVTLVFSRKHYEAVAEAYLRGLEKLAERGGDLSVVASVVSFSVSRVDVAVERALGEIGEVTSQGQNTIASAKVTYACFRENFGGPRWERLAGQGARVQRLLWADTSIRNPTYPDTVYIDALIGPDTVSAVSPATLRAFLDHGVVEATLEADLKKARDALDRLAGLGIDLDTITQDLPDASVDSSVRSFESLRDRFAQKHDRLLAGWEHQTASLGTYQETVDKTLAELTKQKIIERIWAHDHTVWRPEPDGITNRLGWLHIADVMQDNVYRLEGLADSARADGYSQALLLGMGGSSLAPDVFRKTFGVKDGYLDLAVLDSTDPGAVLACEKRLDLSRTLFVVATKSGGTVETLSFFKYFYNRVAEVVGEDEVGSHFVAITDTGTNLARLARQYNFRATFFNDPNIGGRYSALSYFGLLPAVLVGVDVHRLLDSALVVSCGCDSCVGAVDNPAARLGAIMGGLAKAGRDKVTMIASAAIASFGDWMEQLIAESTGKNRTGIVPVVGESLSGPRAYGDDRLFVYLRLEGDGACDAGIDALEKAGHPVVRLHLRDTYDLGGQCFLWELATAVAGHLLGIQPFDQPNVEAAKVLARQMVATYTERGMLPPQTPALTDGSIAVYGDLSARSAGEALAAFLAKARAGDYVALQAYVQPTGETDGMLRALQTALRDHSGLATTLGYGPRFLHSTGQLHKGDRGNGLFIQFTADDTQDVAIPDEAGAPDSAITFGVLKAAQAMGDRQALLDAGRRVIRFHLGDDAAGGVRRLLETLAG